MKTDLELALECIVNLYHKYALKYPLDDYLSKPEFSQMLKETAKPFLQSTLPPKTSIDDYISQLFSKADHNHDGRLKFTEFLSTLSLVFIDGHNRSHQPIGDHGHDHGHDDHGHDDHGHHHDHDHGHHHHHDHDHDHGPRK
ncbi:PREDICTED: protein S100-A7-like [Mesitornis unicolor]|uniref:protein S100-A7-like n=1 Tax=Mesitornis unicolor TaxID=54374 RepID=UPI0005290296|nr:PREDICTED: protein S100-A7-like [Mesitornis unicolor]